MNNEQFCCVPFSHQNGFAQRNYNRRANLDLVFCLIQPVFLPICLFINFRRKPSQKWFALENLIEHALYEIIADLIEIIGFRYSHNK